MTTRLATLALALLCATGAPRSAQWLNEPAGARMEFVLDPKGQVDHAIFRIVEKDSKGIRK